MEITIQLPDWAIFATQDGDGQVDIWSGDPVTIESSAVFVSGQYRSRTMYRGDLIISNWKESKVDLRTHDVFINKMGVLCKVERLTELPSMLKPQHDL